MTPYDLRPGDMIILGHCGVNLRIDTLISTANDEFVWLRLLRGRDRCFITMRLDGPSNMVIMYDDDDCLVRAGEVIYTGRMTWSSQT